MSQADSFAFVSPIISVLSLTKTYFSLEGMNCKAVLLSGANCLNCPNTASSMVRRVLWESAVIAVTTQIMLSRYFIRSILGEINDFAVVLRG